MFPSNMFARLRLASSPSRSGRASRQRVGFRPWLELLEKRFAPATFTVNETADNGDYDPSTHTGSLRGCIGAASSDFSSSSNTIGFDSAVFATPQIIHLDPNLGDIEGLDSFRGGGLTINAPPANSQGQNLVTISGDNNSFTDAFLLSAVPVVSVSFTFNNMNFQDFLTVHGIVSPLGQSVEPATLAFNNCNFFNNSNSSTSLGDSSAGLGGAIQVRVIWDLSITGCSFTDNTAVKGGAIYFNGGNLTIKGTTINGNNANYSGGGVLIDPATANISSSTISNNWAPTGADVYNLDSTTYLVNSTVGDLYNDTGTVSLVNSTVSSVSNNGGTVSTPDSTATDLSAQISALVQAGTLTADQAAGLTSKLQAAAQSLDAGNLTPGANQLSAFINQVNGFVKAHKLTAAQGQSLTDPVNQLINALSAARARLLNDTGLASTDSQPVTDVGQLVTGPVGVYLDNADGTPVSADEQARFDDAIATLDATFGPYGVDLVDVGAADAADAVVQVEIAAGSAAGSAADGVLGCTVAGQITLLTGWNWFTGADPTTIGSDQYDFETIVMHELGHAIGLGHSGDGGSVMYPYLAAGQARRVVTTQDMSVLDSGGTAPAALMAAPWRQEAVVSGPNPHAAVVYVGPVPDPPYETHGRDALFAMIAGYLAPGIDSSGCSEHVHGSVAAADAVFSDGLGSGPASQALALRANFETKSSDPIFAAPLPPEDGDDGWFDVPLFPEPGYAQKGDANQPDSFGAPATGQGAEYLPAELAFLA
jgi:predicted Zn-dependent protease